MTAYTAWSEASKARQDFYTANVNNWTNDVAKVYTRMCLDCDRLFLDWRVESTNRTLEEVEAAINDSIHSSRD